MVCRKPRRKPLGTIWQISDELWQRIEPILKEFWPKKPTGRRVANWRKMLNAIIFRIAQRLPVGPIARAVRSQEHRPRLVPALGRGRDLRARSGRCWSPSATNSAGCSGSGNRPTRCWARPGSGGKRRARIPPIAARKGTKKSLVTDGDGGPLGVVIAGANVRGAEASEGDDRGDRGRAARPDGGESRICAWTRGTTTRTAKGRRPQRVTSRTSGGSARRRRRATGRRATSRDAGWWSGRSRGCRSAGASWCGTTRRTATTWV